ncbi:MAG: hypothetical protein JW913_18495 [Chitinispirillaceae bacterium]|nr:hypothetical protein [Chitinispirillaceae bacterium]
MRQTFILLCAFLVMTGCGPKEVHRELTTFSYIMIDMVKIEAQDYSELIGAVNEQFSPKTKEFNDARLFKEEGMFMYFRVYSGASTACHRVTVDRNRSKIISIQPDCPIEEE